MYGIEELTAIASKLFDDFTKLIEFIKGQQVRQPFASADEIVPDNANLGSSNLSVPECVVDCLNEVPTSSDSS